MRRQPRHIYATPKQLRYLRILLARAFSERVEGCNWSLSGNSSILKSEASVMIETLKSRLAAKAGAA